MNGCGQAGGERAVCKSLTLTCVERQGWSVEDHPHVDDLQEEEEEETGGINPAGHADSGERSVGSAPTVHRRASGWRAATRAVIKQHHSWAFSCDFDPPAPPPARLPKLSLLINCRSNS